MCWSFNSFLILFSTPCVTYAKSLQPDIPNKVSLGYNRNNIKLIPQNNMWECGVCQSVDWSHLVLRESVAGFTHCVSVDWIYLFVCEDVDWIFLLVTVER
jgi:hypothetical protein